MSTNWFPVDDRAVKTAADLEAMLSSHLGDPNIVDRSREDDAALLDGTRRKRLLSARGLLGRVALPLVLLGLVIGTARSRMLEDEEQDVGVAA